MQNFIVSGPETLHMYCLIKELITKGLKTVCHHPNFFSKSYRKLAILVDFA